MGLLSRLAQLEPAETWPQLRASALERYWDGLALATGPESRRTGAIYLLGYDAELILKVAFYRVFGFRADQPVETTAIKLHSAWQKKSNLHNLVALADVLISQRELIGIPFDPVFAAELTRNVGAVAAHWSETLRYRRSMATESELAEVYRAVEWLLEHQNTLES